MSRNNEKTDMDQIFTNGFGKIKTMLKNVNIYRACGSLNFINTLSKLLSEMRVAICNGWNQKERERESEAKNYVYCTTLCVVYINRHNLHKLISLEILCLSPRYVCHIIWVLIGSDMFIIFTTLTTFHLRCCRVLK